MKTQASTKRIPAIIAGLALSAFGLATAQAEQVIQKKVSLSADLITAVTGGCTNSPGPWITLGPSTILLEDVEVTVQFDGGGSHDENVVRTVDLVLDLGEAIVLPKQGAYDNGVTGNPKISIFVEDQLIFGPVRCNKI